MGCRGDARRGKNLFSRGKIKVSLVPGSDEKFKNAK